MGSPAEGGTTGRRFVGIDLAADPARTGLAVLCEKGADLVIDRVLVGAEDEAIITAVNDCDRAGVDVPTGWPDAFVELVGRHAIGELEAPQDTGLEWRRDLVLRATDRALQLLLGMRPLSVSADRIAHPALRWAGIEATLRAQGLVLPRDGSGLIAEVYPAAALASWGLIHRGYKGKGRIERRRELVAELADLLPWLDWRDHRDLCAADDNALDAVVAALVAREVERGNFHPPPESLRGQASREGWICVPREAPRS